MTVQTLHIFSLNVGMSNSLVGLTALISALDLDIIFLQEIRMTNDQIESQVPGFNAVANVDSDNLATPGTASALLYFGNNVYQLKK